MIDIAGSVLPSSLHDTANWPHLAQAYHRAANTRLVDAETHAAKAKGPQAGSADDIAQLEAKAMLAKHDAESYFSSAKALEQKINDGKSLYAKAKKPVINALIATAVAAEIISIPILIANCAVVGRHNKHPKFPLDATLSPS